MTKAEDDQFVWLEEVEGKKQLDWVQGKNKQTLSFVEADKRFEPVKQDLIDIYTADDRIPMPKYDGQYVHNFWRDKKNVRGIWRRTSRISYRKKSPKMGRRFSTLISSVKTKKRIGFTKAALAYHRSFSVAC
jgi:prolyl oligopeptidase